jgi:predicted permease
MVFGGNKTSGALQQLLIQGVIPMTMFFSWLVSLNILAFIFRKILDVHYRWGHYIGAGIIMGGILLALIPKMLDNGGEGNTAFGIIVFFLSNVPTAFSGVYKEIAFKGEEDLDIYYVNAYVAVFQFVLGWIYAPVTAIPGFGGISIKEIPRNLADGGKCLFAAINSEAGDDCSLAWAMTLGYVVANIFYNIVILLMLKYGSAALLYVASAVILPLANIAFTLHFIMGDRATKLSPYDIGGLVVILTGLIIYRSMRESAKTSQLEEKREPTHVHVGSFMAPDLSIPRADSVVPVEHQPRSVAQIRSVYFSRLGVVPRTPSAHNI